VRRLVGAGYSSSASAPYLDPPKKLPKVDISHRSSKESANMAYYRQTQNAVNASTLEHCDATILIRRSLVYTDGDGSVTSLVDRRQAM
jgi:hypothetical protein